MVVLVVFTALLLFVSIGVWVSMISDREYEFAGVLGATFCGLLAVFFMFGMHMKIKEGAEVTYKATITDFNEAYEQGYKIVSQDGKIFTLEKSK